MSIVVFYCWCHSDSASVLLYFTFLWQNMASIGDSGVKKLRHFYEFCPACVNVVTMKSLNAVYYEST